MKKISWMTPWNARSAIAEFSSNVTRELQRRAFEVTIYRTESGDPLQLESLPFDGKVLILNGVDPSTIRNSYDYVVANIGDNFPFHGALPRIMEHVPALGLFHDGFIANFAAGWSKAFANLQDSPLELVQAQYPKDFEASRSYWLSVEEMVERRPMLEWLAGTCSGAFTHSRYWVERLKKATPGTVTTHPLTMPDHFMPPPPAWSGPVVVATIGHVNPNKRADQILFAIASDPILRTRCEYRLLGHVEDGERDRLSRLARSLGLDVPRFTGWIEAEELQRQVAQVHVLSCLRHPIFETGSASLILAMRSGRPVLVSDEGVYGDVDDSAVLKCAPGNEAADIARHLLSLMRNPRQRDEIARSAVDYVERANSLSSYVDALERAMVDATANAPRVAMYRALGRSLGSMAVHGDSDASDRIALGLDGMFASRAPQSLAD